MCYPYFKYAVHAESKTQVIDITSSDLHVIMLFQRHATHRLRHLHRPAAAVQAQSQNDAVLHSTIRHHEQKPYGWTLQLFMDRSG